MARLAAGVQYGLSSQNTSYNNKELVLVKLTDSAQRAIESYLRNQNLFDKKPTIQFDNNKGQIIFPSVQNNHSIFTFSLSSNHDGGFECIQQTGPKNLESLGTLPCKMQIQANDDVYETTKQRLHVVEENNKNKATRVIKTNEPVRKRFKGNPPSSLKITSLKEHSNTNVSKMQESKFSRTSINLPSRFTSSSKSNNFNSTSSYSKTNDQKKNGNVMGRPLKERLIHLLALKPFKKLEVHDRINREGIKEKEKNTIEKTLKEISFLRDNAYYLKRYLWNDVQEEWPFYSEQEKIILKRRKPQNLTPPGSSDGASNGSNEENITNSIPVFEKPGAVKESLSFSKNTFSGSNTSIYSNNTQYSVSKKQHKEQKQSLSVSGKKIDNRYEKSPSVGLPNFEMLNHEGSYVFTVKSLEIKNNDKIRDYKQQPKHNLLDVKSSTNQISSEVLDYPENNKVENLSFSTTGGDVEDFSDFKKNYTTINNLDQRRLYKDQYSKNLEEYQQLCIQINYLNNKFSKLRDKWKRIQNGNESGVEEEVKNQIYQEYEETKHVKKRQEYLYEKLNHIKQLVAEYDAQVF